MSSVGGVDFHDLERRVKDGGRFLIINTDDMGMSPGITDGIVKAYEKGLATDISLIVTMADSKRAAGLVKERGLNAGVHIDLTCQSGRKRVGRPVSGSVPSLIDKDGCFYKASEFRKRILSGLIDKEDLEREIRAQVKLATDWGLELTHLDSNEGVHNYYPEVLRIVLDVARELDLPVRWPNPIYPDWLRSRGILTTDRVIPSLYGVRGPSKKRVFLRWLDELKPGITEVIFHPGVQDKQTALVTSLENRMAELDVLMDGEVASAIEERGIQLLSFKEIRERQRDMRRRGVGKLKAGSARVSITPPFPTQMGGFFDRQQLSEGVHDPLFARSLYISDGRNDVVLTSVDLLYVDGELVSRVRKELSRRTGLPEESFVVFSTHTHSGPEGHHKLAGLLGFLPNPRLRDFLFDRICCSAIEAISSATDARIGASRVSVEGLSSNRHREGGPIDPDLSVLRVEGSRGEPIGALVNFTAHPVIMGSKNLLSSGDYPGEAMSSLEKLLGGSSVCLFANGACGDVTIRRRASSFSEVERVGRMLASKALEALESGETTEEVRISHRCSTARLPMRRLPDIAEANRIVEELRERISRGENGQLEKKLARAQGILALSERSAMLTKMLGESVETLIEVVAINDTVIVGVPAELFVEYGLEIKEKTRGRTVVIAGYCNDIVGYVVTPETDEEGGYEAGASIVDPSSGRIIVDTALRLAREISEDRQAGTPLPP